MHSMDGVLYGDLLARDGGGRGHVMTAGWRIEGERERKGWEGGVFGTISDGMSRCRHIQCPELRPVVVGARYWPWVACFAMYSMRYSCAPVCRLQSYETGPTTTIHY